VTEGAATYLAAAPANPRRLRTAVLEQFRYGAWPGSRWVLPAAFAGFLVAGGLVTLRPLATLTACVVAAFVIAIWLRPALGAYALILVTPLTAGIDRDVLIPFFRPSEAALLFIGGVLMARGVMEWRTGAIPRIRFNRVEVALTLMATAGSLFVLLKMAVLGQEIAMDDILYALVLWKFFGVYGIVRCSVKTGEQVRRALWICIGAACIVAVIALLQAAHLFGVDAVIAKYFATGGVGAASDLHLIRGSSTVGLPAATADVLIFNLAVVGGFWTSCRRHKPALAAIALLFMLGVVACGEFSSLTGLVVGICCIWLVTGSAAFAKLFVVAGAAAAVGLQNIIVHRLEGFQSQYGIPESWVRRYLNLVTYFWPKLSSDYNYVLGVRPMARVEVAFDITGFVWIEMGYMWLLWGGGIPLVASFVYFVKSSLTMAWRAARTGLEAARPAAVGAFTAVVVMSVLMVFDPHLTYRGAADMLFTLLALAGPRLATPPGGGDDADGGTLAASRQARAQRAR